ncbi:MAG: hypothetical protein ABIP36_09305 [Acidimicrobiales bacterium]
MSSQSRDIRYGQVGRDYGMRLATTPLAEDGPAQHAHREVAIADTYALILRPTSDRLAESTAS